VCTEGVGRVASIDDAAGMALVETAGRMRRASLALLQLEGGEVTVGDWVLTHTGLVTARIEEIEARTRLAEQTAMREGNAQ
jgi:hydrogenase assembly chaperone HypC/HupF